MKCRFCNLRSDFIEAHVIPAGFFRPFREEGVVPRLVSSNDYPKRIPAGIYDKTIVCGGCEPRFGPWDQYAIELLGDESPVAEIKQVGSHTVGYEFPDWRYEPLKLFFISLVWRAAVSTHPMYSKISLGPHLETARSMLLKGDPGPPQAFAVLLSRFGADDGRVIMDPHPEKFQGVNFLRFYLGIFVAFVKVDKRPAPAWMGPFILDPKNRLKVLGRDLWRSKEAPILRKMLGQPKNRRGNR